MKAWNQIVASLRLPPPSKIDARISFEIGFRIVSQLKVYRKELPGYRFVDVYRATEEYSRSYRNVIILESEHDEDLTSLLHGKRPQWPSRKMKTPSSVPWATGPGEESYLPIERFWLCRPALPDQRACFILRVRHQAYLDRTCLEAAFDDAAAGEACVEAIVRRSSDASIYRNKIIEVTFDPGVKDEYGDVERTERFNILFKAEEPVDDDDIVMDGEIRDILWRNVIELHIKREVLKAHGVPLRRGVLLYGPPGTGKTFACRYLCGKLPHTTRIIASGTTLPRVKSIFNLARMLQPSLVILEDVDLVFASREVNLYSSVLGDLLDQMDGLRPHEDVSVVLTTNSIERLEPAIKDRPGRISQCIHFGPPNDALRKQYLIRYLRSYTAPELNIEDLVMLSKGATQAFLKEWVHRSVQIAVGQLTNPEQQLQLSNDDFQRAMQEMRKFSEGSTSRIVGFHT